jgi:SAM-dependent methyltransferase
MRRRAARQFKAFAGSAASDPRFSIEWNDRRLFMDDASAVAPFDRHYTYHVAWAARVLAHTRPAVHTDIASLLYFSVVLSAFLPTEFYDYRRVDIELDALSSGTANLIALPFADRSKESVSCMHVLEHVGLGRYGDPLDAMADRRAMAELERVLAPSGNLLVVVPVGAPRVIFNAHRIYSYDQIVEGFGHLDLEEFALIPDRAEDGALIRHAAPELVQRQQYACGCFWFKRRDPMVDAAGGV